MPHETLLTSDAPKPAGPYSQAVAAEKFVFISGQIPLDPETGLLKGSSIKDQARQSLRNLKAVLTAAGLAPDALVKVTVFLRSMDDSTAFNAVYEEELGTARPARSMVGAGALPKDALVEIEAVACR
jgi:2-iminobutanoate/2-iminopropanoate deaminase